MIRKIFSFSVVSVCIPLTIGCASVSDSPRNGSDFASKTNEDGRARNVILFIGDGMGVSTVTAGRIYDGQSRGESGEENVLAFENFPRVALVKTYNSNQQVPDSAGTASAIHTGVKTRAGMIGVGPAAYRGDCAGALKNIVPTAGETLFAQGKAIGLVTTARVTHATPAAVFAHVPERNWEDDTAVPAEELSKGCRDIAQQLVDFPFTVAMGGGRNQFFGQRKNGTRRDAEADLVGAWREKTEGRYITTRTDMDAAVKGNGPLLGLFSDSLMTYMLDRQPDTTEPTLTEMTSAAIDRLSRHTEGYFLLVEGGRIDYGHHDGKAAYALSEVQELSRAVAAAVNKVDLSNTLILVTADHSHAFTISGYPTRGNPILGMVVENDERGIPKDRPSLAKDGQPYTTLGYQNGPGAVGAFPRPSPSIDPRGSQQALVPFANETHGGEDVPLYATGAGASSVGGVIEQNRIYNIILGALGIM